MKDLKMWAYHQKMNSHDYAGEVDRVRCWWAACAGVHPDQYQLATSWFTRLLALFKMTGANMSIDQHMDKTEDERVESSSRLNIPLFSSFGPRGSQSKQDAPDWKLDHFDVCKAHKFPWPLVDKNRKCVVRTPSMLAIAGLFPREQEATCILDMLWPPAEDGGPVYAFLDINPTLKRIVSTRLENEVGIPKPDSSPWSASSPTQVGSGHMLVRYKMSASDQVRYAPHKFGIRLVEAYECIQ